MIRYTPGKGFKVEVTVKEEDVSDTESHEEEEEEDEEDSCSECSNDTGYNDGTGIIGDTGHDEVSANDEYLHESESDDDGDNSDEVESIDQDPIYDHSDDEDLNHCFSLLRI